MIADVVALKDDEKIISITRRHWFGLAVEGVLDAFIFIATATAVVLMDVISAGSKIGLTEGQTYAIGFFVLGFVGLLVWMHFFASWTDHWLDAWIITTERVIDIEQHGFFRREVSSFPLNRIQDVTYTVSGIIPTWLHFGDVRIQTASISEDFIMRQVPFPQAVKDHLLQVIDTS